MHRNGWDLASATGDLIGTLGDERRGRGGGDAGVLTW